MDKYIIKGGNVLQGQVKVSGAKNSALKALVAACLSAEKVTLHNVPHISDIFVMLDIMKDLGAQIEVIDHTITVEMKQFAHFSIPLDKAALARTSAMFLAPLLARSKEAIIPNPGGCRLGARPIDRIVEGIGQMNVDITYHSEDGYFHAKTSTLHGVRYRFKKSTHTGTETMIIAAVLAKGTTVLENAAEEPEIDDLVNLLNAMGAKIKRTAHREITIEGVDSLHGAEFTISPDRIEVATFAIAAYVTGGNIFVEDGHKAHVDPFLEKLKQAGAPFTVEEHGIRFHANGALKAVDVTTGIHPGFLTDWQALWAVLMTQAEGESVIHETVFENKLGYVKDLKKMGAKMKRFNPPVENKEETYNFNLEDDMPEYKHAVRIVGPTKLHNAVMTTLDIRAGAAIVLAALAAKGRSTIFGVEKLERGYERFDERLRSLGADIQLMRDHIV